MADVPMHIHLDTDAVTASVLKTVRLDVEAIRAQVAEEIALAIEAARSHPEHEPTCQSCIVEAVHIERYAALARGYTQAGQEPADRQETT